MRWEVFSSKAGMILPRCQRHDHCNCYDDDNHCTKTNIVVVRFCHSLNSTAARPPGVRHGGTLLAEHEEEVGGNIALMLSRHTIPLQHNFRQNASATLYIQYGTLTLWNPILNSKVSKRKSLNPRSPLPGYPQLQHASAKNTTPILLFG